MNRLIKNNFALVLPLLLFFIFGGLIILISEKFALHVFFNGLVKDNISTFFIYLTYLGDGWIIVCALLIILFFNLRLFFTCGLSYATSSGITQGLKNYFFKGALRPKPFFEQHHQEIKLQLIEGVEIFGENSFPSGHTTAAFSFFLCLGLISNNQITKTICLIVALLVGLSRIYLSQHFFEDVYAGSVIGSCCAFLFSYIFYFSEGSGRFNRIDTSMLNFISQKRKDA